MPDWHALPCTFSGSESFCDMRFRVWRQTPSLISDLFSGIALSLNIALLFWGWISSLIWDFSFDSLLVLVRLNISLLISDFFSFRGPSEIWQLVCRCCTALLILHFLSQATCLFCDRVSFPLLHVFIDLIGMGLTHRYRISFMISLFWSVGKLPFRFRTSSPASGFFPDICLRLRFWVRDSFWHQLSILIFDCLRTSYLHFLISDLFSNIGFPFGWRVLFLILDFCPHIRFS